MPTVRINDNTHVAAERLQSVRHVTDRIANVTVSQLAHDGLMLFPRTVQESEDLSADQMILHRDGSGYRSENMMGYVGSGTELLVIQSRFSQDGRDYFLQYLMQRVLGMPNLLDLDISADEEHRLFMFQIFLFPLYLHAAMRKGPFREYVHRERNDANVQGRIDVDRHVRQNIPFTGNIAYSVRDFSGDNPVMELIRHTAEYIAAQPYGAAVLHDVRSEIRMVAEATPEYRPANRERILERNMCFPVRHAFYSEYRALQQLCIMILSHRRHGIGNSGRQIQGVIFDGAWLWEEYVNLLVGDLFHHPRNKSRAGSQRLFNGGNGLIYPDFIGRDAARRVIADAKYKPAGNIRNRDYLQILAYMYRFDARQGFFLYPDSDSAERSTLHLMSGTTFDGDVRRRDDDIRVIKHGFAIPQSAPDYERYAAEMRDNERRFRESLTAMMR